MNTITLLAALIIPLASQAAPVALKPDAGSALWIEGDSTLHPFASTSTAVGFELTLDRGEAESPAAAAKSGKPAKLTVKVPVASLKSSSKSLDKNLRKAMKAEEHPEVLFTLESYKAEGASVQATGTLTIAGVSKPATVKGTLAEKDGKLVLEGDHSLKMSEFGIKPPKMMMGAVKVADEIAVKFRFLLAAAN